MNDDFLVNLGNHFLQLLQYGAGGLVLALAILYVLTQVKGVQRVAFPFIDELNDLAKRWRDGKVRPQDGLLAIAFALYSGAVAFGVFFLIANLGTPLG